MHAWCVPGQQCVVVAGQSVRTAHRVGLMMMMMMMLAGRRRQQQRQQQQLVLVW